MATDTFTSLLGAILMGTGNDNNTWGANLNTAAIQILEDSIVGALVTPASGGAIGPGNILDLSASPPPAGPSQARWATLGFFGTLTADQIVIVPNLRKVWLVDNECVGAKISFKTPSGAAVVIPVQGFVQVSCDGANNMLVGPYFYRQVRITDGGAAVPPYSYASEVNSGWYRAGTQDVRLSINGLDVLQVTGAGASSPSLVNIVAPNVLSFGGVKFDATSVCPVGMETHYSGILPPVGWLLCAGEAVSRTTFVNLFGVITALATGNTHGSTLVDGMSADLTGLGLEGAFIEGTGFGIGNKIVSITSTSITTLNPVSGTNSGVQLRILPYGQGDGSTTFNVPDRRGRFVAGRDNMGGTAAGNLTGLTGGILGTQLGAVGGEQTHTLIASEIPAHTHSITDPGHTHQFTWDTQNTTAGGQANARQIAQTGLVNTVTTQSATTGITATNNNAGGGGAHNNVPPAGISNIIIKT